MSDQKEQIKRFGLAENIEHALLLVSFTGLGLTGLPQRFSQAAFAQGMIGAMGGIESVRIGHRVFATMMMVVSIYHILSIIYKLFVLRQPAFMLPTFKDAKDLVDVLAYNLGFKKEHPKMDRFNFEEKLEYWAVLWGLGVMGATGFMLWNPVATAQFLPGEAIPAAKAAHGLEAILAVAAIILWHFYNVLIAHWNLSMFTGKINKHIVEEKHALELERIEAGTAWQPPQQEIIRKRLRWFIPVAIVLTAAMLVGPVLFITFEQTAITTLPPL